jgi:hypothetical protein
MKFSLAQDYPADLRRLWATLGRAEYVEQKYRSLGAAALRILKLQVTDDVIDVELERSAPVAREELPRWARAVLRGTQPMHHHTRWSRAGAARVEAELDIAPVGIPVRAHGVGSVAELAPDRTRLTLDFDVECRLPVVGAEVARVFAEQVKAALRADHAFTLEYLAANAPTARR